jgi:MFS family permease
VSATIEPARALSTQPAGFSPGAVLGFVCLGQFMVFIDVLPSIQEGLAMSDVSLNYIVTAYATVLGGFLLLGGRLADRFGRRRILQCGFAVFALASLVSGLAESGAMLIAARAAQGLGAALITPSALSILTSTFAEGPERNRALGVWGSLTGVATALTCALLLLIFTLGEAARVGWGTARTISGLAGAAVLLGAFLVVESRARAPMIPLRVFRLRSMRTANIAAVLVFGTFSALFFFASLFMQQAYGYSPLTAGVAYLPLAVCVAAGAGIASGLIAKVEARRVLLAGLGMTIVGLLLLSRAPVGGSYVVDLLPAFLILGLGCGACYVTLQIAAFVGVSEEEMGLGAGLINTSQEAGGALGLAVVVGPRRRRPGPADSAGQQRRLCPRGARDRHDHEAVGRSPRREPPRSVLLHAGDLAAHDCRRLGAHRQHLEHLRPRRRRAHRLPERKGRADRVHQDARPRARPSRDHGQRYRARPHRR